LLYGDDTNAEEELRFSNFSFAVGTRTS